MNSVYLKVVVAAFAVLGLTVAVMSGWHLYTDHTNFDRMVIWVAQKQAIEQQQAQRAAQQRQQQQQAPVPAPVPEPAK